jgi:hypothetical protein
MVKRSLMAIQMVRLTGIQTGFQVVAGWETRWLTGINSVRLRD